MSSKKHIELFRIGTEEYDAFEGKSLDMLKHLLNNCESMYIHKSCDGEIELVFSKIDKDKK